MCGRRRLMMLMNLACHKYGSSLVRLAMISTPLKPVGRHVPSEIKFKI